MNYASSRFLGINTSRIFSKMRPGVVLGLIILTALVAFEMFNYSTTEYALRDLLGNLKFAGIGWSTILSIAFCGIDFAGIARLFTPEQGWEEPKEVWYLFGAWLLAATMNALLTWWGVAMAMSSHAVKSTAIVDVNTLTKVIPVFVAVMVWVIRILIIGSISVAGDRVIWGSRTVSTSSQVRRPALNPNPVGASPALRSAAPTPRPLPRPAPSMSEAAPALRSEPTYHSLSASARPNMSRPPVSAAPSSGSEGNPPPSRRL